MGIPRKQGGGKEPENIVRGKRVHEFLDHCFTEGECNGLEDYDKFAGTHYSHVKVDEMERKCILNAFTFLGRMALCRWTVYNTEFPLVEGNETAIDLILVSDKSEIKNGELISLTKKYQIVDWKTSGSESEIEDYAKQTAFYMHKFIELHATPEIMRLMQDWPDAKVNLKVTGGYLKLLSGKMFPVKADDYYYDEKRGEMVRRSSKSEERKVESQPNRIAESEEFTEKAQLDWEKTSQEKDLAQKDLNILARSAEESQNVIPDLSDAHASPELGADLRQRVRQAEVSESINLLVDEVLSLRRENQELRKDVTILRACIFSVSDDLKKVEARGKKGYRKVRKSFRNGLQALYRQMHDQLKKDQFEGVRLKDVYQAGLSDLVSYARYLNDGDQSESSLISNGSVYETDSDESILKEKRFKLNPVRNKRR